MTVMDLQVFLEKKVNEYEQPSFIDADPICIPHTFSKKQDIEIAGFFSALFAWGNRTTIISKSTELMCLMGGSPYAFCMEHSKDGLQQLLSFRHRTFTATDILYIVGFLHHHYQHHDSLETAFNQWMTEEDPDTENALNGFYHYFFSLDDVPARTRKHIAAPFKKSTCKRLNMYLRWMVRSNRNGVDFGLWTSMRPDQLLIPLDLHVARVARHFGLLTRKQTDWQAVQELTTVLRQFNPHDPARYDFALFALGVLEKNPAQRWATGLLYQGREKAADTIRVLLQLQRCRRGGAGCQFRQLHYRHVP
jgi:uncharacterized protein (TIGR02757 family)